MTAKRLLFERSGIFAECGGFWAKNDNLFCPKLKTRLSQKFQESEFSRFGLNLKMTKPLLALRRVTGPQRLKPLTLTLRRKCAVSSPLAFLLTAWLAPINEPASAVADDFGSLAPIRFLGNEKSDCERSAESGGLTRSETRLSRAIKTSKAPDRAEEKNYCKKMLNRGAQLQSQHSMLQHDRVMIKI